jgi:hypothetical protein
LGVFPILSDKNYSNYKLFWTSFSPTTLNLQVVILFMLFLCSNCTTKIKMVLSTQFTD